MRILLADQRRPRKPGDIFLYNDPYGSGGQHLPDIYIVKPIFHDGVIEGWACTMAHHCDVGGIAPGSIAIHATEIFQEGICLPLVKLYEAGEPNEMLLRILEKNTRLPVQLLGDMRAQLAACAVGERGYRQLLAKYGAEGSAPLPRRDAGSGRAHDAQRHRGHSRRPLFVRGLDRRRRRASRAARASPSRSRSKAMGSRSISPAPRSRCAAAVNCPIAMVNSSTYCAIRCLTDREIPNCEGYMRPVKLIAPRGTILNPEHPAACAARGVMGYRVFDAIMGALAQVVPERVIAGCEGGPTLFSIGGRQNGKPFVLTEVMVGTWGARAALDGDRRHLQSGRQPLQQSGRADRGRAAAAGDASTASSRIPAGRASSAAGSRSAAPTGCSPMRRSAPCAPTGATIRPMGSTAASRAAARRTCSIPEPRTSASLPTMPMAAIPLRKGDVFRHVSAGGGGLRACLRARARAGAGRCARRQGLAAGRRAALRRRDRRHVA